MTAFDEKYRHYKKTDRFSAPDGYVDDIASRISDTISERRSSTAFRTWSVSLSVAGALVLGWFLYPLFSSPTDTEQPSMAYTGTAGQSLARLNMPIPVDAPDLIPKKDSGNLAAVNVKAHTPDPEETLTLNDLSREDIMEYLLDENFEEI